MAFTPGSMALDLLRLVDGPLSISVLCAAGENLGFAVGTTRVALTRLVRGEKVTRDNYGHYSLAPALDSVTDFINAWQEGDRRIRAWEGDWLCVWHPRGIARTERRRSRRALELFGLREGMEGTWVRPNNLSRPLPDLRGQLQGLGLVAEAKAFVASDVEGAEEWSSLWPLVELEKRYRRALRNVRRSGTRLAGMSIKRAAVESYHVGDEAMHLLAFDPLLPDEILLGDARRDLTEETLEYLKVAGSVWGQVLSIARRAA